MRKFLIILFGIVSLAVLVGMLWPFETRLSDADLQAITAQVRQKTSEPIISVGAMPRWRAHVQTGKSDGPLSGGGHYFNLRRGWGGWRIYESGTWIG